MAHTIITREGTFAQKKCMSYFAELVEEQDAGNYLIGRLPPDCKIVECSAMTETASDAAAYDITLGSTEGGTELMTAADGTAAGETSSLAAPILTGTGMDVFMGVAVTTPGTKNGKVIISITYLEYTKKSGEYTKFDD